MIQDAYLLAHGKFLPGEERVRPESGALRFPDDWPGVFLRGDEAIGHAADLQKLRDDEPRYAFMLDPLIALLESCKVK